jgi:ABC-2 type transport system ATP-binding protein
VGYLPESVVLYPDMTVRAFLEFAARIKGDTAAQRKQQVTRVLGECDIEHMAHRHIGTLSKGYRQRVGFAQALLCNPEILILDEPTVGLDPHQVIEMRELIKGMGGKTTVLLSSHILSEVGLTCHRVVIIDKGKIIAEDTAEGLSARVQGATRVFVRVAGPQSEVLSALRQTSGIKEALIAPEIGEGQEGHGFLVTSPNTLIAKDIADMVIARQWALHELRPVTLGLEELFVRLTTDQIGQAA